MFSILRRLPCVLWLTPFSTPRSSFPVFSLHFYLPFSHKTLIPGCVFHSSLFSAPHSWCISSALSLLLILHARLQSVYYLHLTFCTVPAFPLSILLTQDFATIRTHPSAWHFLHALYSIYYVLPPVLQSPHF